MHPDKKAWLWVVVLASLLCTVYSSTIKDKSKDSEEWDFEFEEHSRDETSTQKDSMKDLKATYNAWSFADADLCRTVQCKPTQECLIQDENTAICVSAKKVKKMKCCYASLKIYMPHKLYCSYAALLETKSSEDYIFST